MLENDPSVDEDNFNLQAIEEVALDKEV